MKTKRHLLTVVLAGLTPWAYGAGVVDQQQPIIDTTVGGLGIGGSSEEKLAQVVTPGVSGLLTEVQLPIACSQSDVRIEIQDVANGRPNGVILADETFDGSVLPPFFPNPGVVTLRSFAFSSPPAVEASRQFAIVISSPAHGLDGCGIFQGPIGDSYGGGDLFFDARPNPINQWVCVCEFVGDRLDLPFATIVAPPIIEVPIDVKPSSAINPINPHATGVIPVVIFGTTELGVGLMDISTIRFGKGLAPVRRGRAHLEDVNQDGLPDLVVHFGVRQSGIQPGDTQVSITGLTHAGQRFQGADRIVTVGHRESPAQPVILPTARFHGSRY